MLGRKEKEMVRQATTAGAKSSRKMSPEQQIGKPSTANAASNKPASMPSRSNKGGALRGQARAAAVKAMNKLKKSSRASKARSK